MNQNEQTAYQLGRRFHRFLRGLKGESVIANIEDVIDALRLKNHADEKPVLAHYHKEEYGWHVCLSLPWGVSSKDVLKHEGHFVEQTGATCIGWEVKGRLLHMDVVTINIPVEVKYEVSPSEGIAPLWIGRGVKGDVRVDLGEVLSILIGGLPGWGKTNVMHTFTVSLLSSGIKLCILDLKRLEFAYAKKLALVGATNPQALLILTALNKELDKRLNILEKAGCVKLQEHDGSLPYLCLVIDELTELTDENSQELLNRILRLGRAAGVFVIAATQRPSSKTFKDFTESRGLFSATLCFRVRDETNSRMVLDSPKAASLPRIKGRAIWQFGDQEVEVQTPFLPVNEARKLVREIEQRQIRGETGRSDSFISGMQALSGYGANSLPVVSGHKVWHEEVQGEAWQNFKRKSPKKVAGR